MRLPTHKAACAVLVVMHVLSVAQTTASAAQSSNRGPLTITALNHIESDMLRISGVNFGDDVGMLTFNGSSYTVAPEGWSNTLIVVTIPGLDVLPRGTYLLTVARGREKGEYASFEVAI